MGPLLPWSGATTMNPKTVMTASLSAILTLCLFLPAPVAAGIDDGGNCTDPNATQCVRDAEATGTWAVGYGADWAVWAIDTGAYYGSQAVTIAGDTAEAAICIVITALGGTCPELF